MGTARPASGPPGALAAVLLGAILALAALLQGGCEGTSSGVDNPGLTVSFRDADGAPVRVTGDLEVYAAEQNPAVAPQPLRSLRVQNSSFAILIGEDIGQLAAASAAGASARAAPAAKRAAGPTDAAAAFRFNLVFRGDARIGSFASGLAYDKGAASFARAEQDADLHRLDMRPAPLRRLRALLNRGAVHGDYGLVYIPGTPFRATVAEEGFEFAGLPEGTFALRLVGEGGRIFPIVEPLTVQGGTPADSSLTFSASAVPMGWTDTTDTSAFTIEAIDPVEAVVDLPAPLGASLHGVDSTDPRLSVRWRQVGYLPDTARLSFSTRLNAQALFPRDGVYAFEVAATVAGRTVKDSTLVVVRPRPVPPAVISVVAPKRGDLLTDGDPFKITWDMPVQTLVQLLISLDGAVWIPIRDSLKTNIGLNTLTWIPRTTSDSSIPAVIQVRTFPPDTLSGYSAGFSIKGPPVPVDSLGGDSLRIAPPGAD